MKGDGGAGKQQLEGKGKAQLHTHTHTLTFFAWLGVSRPFCSATLSEVATLLHILAFIYIFTHTEVIPQTNTYTAQHSALQPPS